MKPCSLSSVPLSGLTIRRDSSPSRCTEQPNSFELPREVGIPTDDICTWGRQLIRLVPFLGTGAYKLGANYAPGVMPQKKAASEGYNQNLWLHGEEHYLTEVGTMNLFVVFKRGDSKGWTYSQRFYIS